MILALTRVRFRPAAAASAAATYAKPALCRASFSVLAIESSADDTGVAIVTHDRRILSNVVVKQHATHEQYGGIHPIYSVRLHQRNVPGAIRRALAEAGMSASDVDAFAFTRGPGMPGSLGVGANAALSLAAALDKPVVGVHHMQAHALTPLLTSPPPTAPRFPFLTLLVSGGHTLLVLACSPTRFRILASTLDAAAGRVFDKVARMLGLGWGAMGPGAALEEFCGDMSARGDGEDAVVFKPGVPGRLTFSFAGLQSAVERIITGAHTNTNDDVDPASGPPLPDSHRRAIARAFQRAAVAQLVEKVALALEVCKAQGVPVRDVVVSGGVASNRYLRARLEEVVGMEGGVRFVFPPPTLCTDNAAMIAWAAMYRLLARDTDPYTVPIKAKWSIQALAGSTTSMANEAVKAEGGGEEGEEDPNLNVPTTEGLREFYAESLGAGASEDPAAGSTLV